MTLSRAISIPVPRRVIYLRDLLRTLVLRDMKAQYKSSLLGIAWSLLNPVLQLLVFSFLFRVVLPLGIENYHAFAFSGLLAWTWFQLSLVQATASITTHRDLLRRPGFPAGVLPVIAVANNLINFMIALPLLLGIILMNGGSLHATIFALPIVMTLQFMLALGFAYLLATANALFRDVQHLIGVSLQLLFFMTPIFYSTRDRVPERYLWIYELNPLVHLLGAYRDVLVYGRIPSLFSLAMLGCVAAALLLVAYRLFARVRDRLVEEL